MTADGRRLRIAVLGETAVVLDLGSGTVSRVAGSALEICRELAAGRSVEEVALELAQRAGISPRRAREDALAVWSRVTAPLEGRPTNPLSFRRVAAGFEMRCQDRLVLLLEPTGELVAVPDGPTSARDAEWRLRQALPHLLALRGRAVLHAASLRMGEGVLALGGATGAGKSTLAGMMSGGHPISDDLLFLGDEGSPSVVLGAEERARSWTRALAPELARAGLVRLPEDAVQEMLGGPRLPLGELWLLDAATRGGEEMVTAPIPPEQALGEVLLGGFGETGDPDVWDRLFGLAREVAERVRVARVRVPGELPLLRRAVDRWSSAERPAPAR